MNRRPRLLSFQTTRFLVVTTLLGSLAISLLGSAGAHPAQAATTWIVTSLADTAGVCPDANNCTLRQAMTQAMSGDRITFGVSGTILLGSTLPTVSNTLTIDGAGQSVTISGSHSVQIMQVSGTLSLNALTLSNGNGGAISNNSGTLNIANSTFAGNLAPLNGGTISNSSGTLNIANSTFSGNSTPIGSGGAISNSGGTLNIANSTFSGNSAPSGGALYNNAGAVTLNNSILTNNSGGDCSGGGFTSANDLSDGSCGVPANAVTNIASTLGSNGGPTQTFALLTGSNAINSVPNGTCVYVSGGINPLFTNGAALTTDQRGATRPQGALCDSGAYEFTTSLTVNSTSDVAVTCAVAGTVCLRNAMSVIGTGGTITFSVSGTILLGSTLPTVNNTLTIDGTGQSVTISGGNSVQIMQVGGGLSLNALTLSNANGSTGGAIYISSGGTLTITNSTFSNNSTPSGGHGGVLYNGGALYNDGTLTIVNSTFSSNSAPSDGRGGALYNTGTLSITNSTFAGNSATGVGGALSNAGTLTIATSTFSSNSTLLDAGAIFNAGTLTIANSTFASNSTPSGSGAISNSGGMLNVATSTFTGNSATGGGGAISNANFGTLNVANSTFAGNSANLSSGGALYSYNGTLNIANSTFAGNSATGGGAIYNNTSTATLDNSILTNDTGGDCSGTFTSVNDLSDGSCGVSANAVTNIASTLANNGGSTQTFALLTGSNAIDTVPNGTCLYVSSGINPLFTNGATLTTDQRGATRPQGALCDIGAYESISRDSIGVFRSGTFLLRLHNSTGFADISVSFSPAIKPYPVVGDWAGAGYDTVGIFDQTNGLFSLCNANVTATCANSANVTQLVLGIPNDQPLSGKWNAGFTHAGVGVFRPSNGLIYLKNSLATGFADYTMVLGVPGDVGLAGDWNGDGLDSPGVYRPSLQKFYLNDQVCNCSEFATYTLQYGNPGDFPVVGDWVGQGHAGVGLFRQSNGFTYLRNSLTTGFADTTFTYGIAGDVPVAGHYQLVYPPKSNPGTVIVPATNAPLVSGGQNGSNLGD